MELFIAITLFSSKLIFFKHVGARKRGMEGGECFEYGKFKVENNCLSGLPRCRSRCVADLHSGMVGGVKTNALPLWPLWPFFPERVVSE